jgi:hypothetical protein
MENTHLFDEQADNVINPLTGTRPYPAINQVEHKGNWGVGKFEGLIGSLQRTARNGLFVGLNYTYSHADNDSDIDPENVACRACSWGNAAYDVRQNLYIQSSYPLPLGDNIALRNWTISGVASIRTGLPLNITLTRATTVMADGNNTSQRPNAPQRDGTPVGPKGEVVGEWKLDKTFGDGAKAKPRGVIYIVSGAGGAELYNPEQQTDPSSWQTFTDKFISQVHSLSVVDIKGKTLRLKQVSESGESVDAFQVSK